METRIVVVIAQILLGLYSLWTGFEWFQMGYAATIAVVLFASIFAIRSGLEELMGAGA